jgi:hypothetical protein
MKEIIEYEIDTDDSGDEIFADSEISFYTADLESDDISTIDIGLGNRRKITLQNHIARLKIEQRQERLRLRKLLEDY